MSDELRPCPFCGANDPYHEISEDEAHIWVACGNCFATSSRVHTSHNISADKSWNQRPIEDALTAENAALKSRLAQAREFLDRLSHWDMLWVGEGQPSLVADGLYWKAEIDRIRTKLSDQ